MSVKQINSLIYAATLSNDDLNSIIEAIKYKRGLMARATRASLMVGDNVSFTSSKTGRNTTGVVTKIAIKYVTVRTLTGLWRVPANMLSKVEEELA